jgi:hypothetical protein
VKLVEPPSCSAASTIVFIGRNRRGQWVAQEQNGLFGGLFVNRAQALKYALFETAIIPKQSSNWRAKSNSTWAVRWLPRQALLSDASRDTVYRHP